MKSVAKTAAIVWRVTNNVHFVRDLEQRGAAGGSDQVFCGPNEYAASDSHGGCFAIVPEFLGFAMEHEAQQLGIAAEALLFVPFSEHALLRQTVTFVHSRRGAAGQRTLTCASGVW